MSARTASHATFVIERTYPASPARVFNAWAEPTAKASWFACHDDWQPGKHELDFRVGGRERLDTVPPDGVVHRYEAHYQDIVPNERIVYAYDMHLGDTRISVSLATVEFAPAGTGTRLTFTEQAVFLDGHDIPRDREEGTRAGLDNLGRVLRGEAVTA
jgi:uncharacterized protein YndB with AHSA1/START domain